ncbi:Response regulator UvrY [Burkholderiales bacterium]|nr:MAG: response regulator transcription factor [Burkholderiales bacterium]CAG0949217.1 Response regulator UvrY [Burkholderiales bacterium]
MSIRILIADDHAIVRSGLKQILATVPDFDVVAETASGEQTFEATRRLALDLALVDLTMPGPSGIDLVQRLRLEHPTLPLLVLTMHYEAQIAARALRAGATGYLTKGSEPEILIAAIRKVSGGGRFIDPSLVDAIVFDAQGLENAPHERLSDREQQVLRMLAGGRSVNDIAIGLHLSAKTISTHKKRIMRKLGVTTNADLFRYAIEHRLTL